MKQLLKIFLAVAFIFSSCTSSRITSSWKAADVQQKQYKKVLVLGLFLEKDRALKEKMEAHIVSDLKALGYDAICSCDEYGPKAFENIKEAEALQKLSGGGIDAVLTVVLLDKTKERYYVPNHVYYSPYSVYHNHWWGYYSTMYDRIYQPGYYAVDTKYFWESNFYDLDTKKLIYSAQTQSFDPSSAESLAHEYGKLIVNDMKNKTVLSIQSSAVMAPPM
ncbi:MAG TPA: hypothetical protein VF144_09600 [Chitinophagaceae bacterium]